MDEQAFGAARAMRYLKLNVFWVALSVFSVALVIAVGFGLQNGAMQ